MARFICDRCGRGLDSLVNTGAVSIDNTIGKLCGYYVFCPECMEVIIKEFREMRLKAIVKEKR